MTVGAKIQYYRKKNGLSQEELGQKMLVSRQTVSLWEMDKTLPTVDNLIRLKAVFSISVDDILNGEEPTEENNKLPEETYSFQYNQDDLKEIFKKMRSPIIKRIIIFTLAFLFALIGISDYNIASRGLFLGCFLMGAILYIRNYFDYRKAWLGNESKVLEKAYSYEVFQWHFVVNISRNNEIITTKKVYFGEIEKIYNFGNYLLLCVGGQLYILRKNSLVHDSKFIVFCNRLPDKVEGEKNRDILKKVSNVLFILSLWTILGALFVVNALSETYHVMLENMWVFFLFLPIPIASILFGFYLKKKGYKYRKNIVAGIVMAVLLCIYGSFCFIFEDEYSHSDEPVLEAEQILNIDIPEYFQINTQDWTKKTQLSHRGHIYYTSDIYFEESEVEEFEKSIVNSSKWIADIPNAIIGITSSFCIIEAENYYIIYNEDTKEFNKLPSESGTYTFINVIYNVENNTMKLIEYEIEYTE